MISLIICSTHSDISAELKQNIDTTIGYDHEYVVIDNSDNRHSIFSAYNEGIRRSKGDILVFMHQDIDYQTINWGGVVAGLLKDNSIGIVGFGGAHFLPSVPMYWSESPIISEYCKHNDNGRLYDCVATDYMVDGLADVAVVDGMCMMARRDVFDHLAFDEKSYSGFHLYDMDICMQIYQQGLRICVTDKILITHHWSESTMYTKKGADALSKNLRIFADKWSTQLPVLIGINAKNVNIDNLNQLCVDRSETEYIRQSKAYLLGRFILHPSVSNLKKLLNR